MSSKVILFSFSSSKCTEFCSELIKLFICIGGKKLLVWVRDLEAEFNDDCEFDYYIIDYDGSCIDKGE